MYRKNEKRMRATVQKGFFIAATLGVSHKSLFYWLHCDISFSVHLQRNIDDGVEGSDFV
jgi:hypothetical protein